MMNAFFLISLVIIISYFLYAFLKKNIKEKEKMCDELRKDLHEINLAEGQWYHLEPDENFIFKNDKIYIERKK